MTVLVRALRPDDAPALGEAWFRAEARSLEEAYPGGYPAGWFWMQSAEHLASWFATATGVLVAERDGTPAGFAQYGDAEGVADGAGVGSLKSLYVHPDVWGAGAGAALHAAVLERLSASYTEAVLWVIEGNARARGFYERRGWIDAGEFRRERNGLPLVRYGRRFGAAPPTG